MKKMSDPFAPWLLTVLCLALTSGGTTVRAENEDDPEGQPDPIGEEPGIIVPKDEPTAYNKASSLLGLAVNSQAGQNLGKLRDIVINPQSGRVSYAVLGVSSGFRGLNEKYLAVPLRAFTTGSSKQCLVLNAEKSSVAQASGFDRNHWPGVGTPAWGAQPFWKEKDSDIHVPTIMPGKMDEKMPESKPESYNEYRDSGLDIDEPIELAVDTGDTGETHDMLNHVEGDKITSPSLVATTNLTQTTGIEPTKFNRVHTLIGMTVRNPQDEELGFIKDIVLDLQSERVSYAVLERPASGGTPAKLFAVPLSAFRPGVEEDYLLLNAERSSLDTASGFPSDAWPSVSNPSWGGQPFWKDLPADLKTSDLPKHKERKALEPMLPPPEN